MKALVLTAALAAGSAHVPATGPAPKPATATLTIKVQDVSPKGGIVRLAVYQAANYDDDDHPTADRNVAADPSGNTITITGLKPGEYAVKMTQDINRNGEFDQSWLGLPLEPYGFSNNPAVVLGEPSFDKTKFALKAGSNTIMIELSGTDGISVPARPTDRLSQRTHTPKSYE